MDSVAMHSARAPHAAIGNPRKSNSRFKWFPNRRGYYKDAVARKQIEEQGKQIDNRPVLLPTAFRITWG